MTTAGPVPLDGPAVFRPGHPPRAGVVELGEEGRVRVLSMREALPVLARAHGRPDLSAATRALSEATVLALRLVAAGRTEPVAESGVAPHWRIGALDDEEAARVEEIAVRADGLPVARLLDAVADALPRSAPAGGAPPRWALKDRLARHLRAPDRRPHLVTISLRVEADEEELVAGGVRLVLQVHDEQDPLHVRDAVDLWTRTPEDHGFGDRARVHATLALRGAAEGWPVLDRLLELQVPDQITLDTDELVSLLDTGVAALRDRAVDVLWPRSLGRDLTTTTVLDRRPAGTREEPLVEGLLGREALFSFHWQVALHGEPLTAAEMDRLAAATTPLLKLRDQWMVVDPAVARRAKKRLVRTVTPVQAVAAALTGVVEVDDVDHDVVVGASLLAVREQLRTAATREPIAPPPDLHATLRDYQRHGLTWLVQLTDLGLGACLADDMGLGKTVTLIALHLHRGGGPTLVVCPASLLGTWESEIHRFAPGARVRRFHGSERDLGGLDGGGPTRAGSC